MTDLIKSNILKSQHLWSYAIGIISLYLVFDLVFTVIILIPFYKRKKTPKAQRGSVIHMPTVIEHRAQRAESLK